MYVDPQSPFMAHSTIAVLLCKGECAVVMCKLKNRIYVFLMQYFARV